jgi:hypothetical protein
LENETTNYSQNFILKSIRFFIKITNWNRRKMNDDLKKIYKKDKKLNGKWNTQYFLFKNDNKNVHKTDKNFPKNNFDRKK